MFNHAMGQDSLATLSWRESGPLGREALWRVRTQQPHKERAQLRKARLEPQEGHMQYGYVLDFIAHR